MDGPPIPIASPKRRNCSAFTMTVKGCNRKPMYRRSMGTSGTRLRCDDAELVKPVGYGEEFAIPRPSSLRTPTQLRCSALTQVAEGATGVSRMEARNDGSHIGEARIRYGSCRPGPCGRQRDGEESVLKCRQNQALGPGRPD